MLLYSAALVYGAKHGGFASLRHLPGLLGGGGALGGGLPLSAFPDGSAHGSGAKAGHQLLTASQGLGAAPCGAPSPVYGPIGGPPGASDVLGRRPMAAEGARGISGAPVWMGGRHSPTLSPLSPHPAMDKRSSRWVTRMPLRFC